MQITRAATIAVAGVLVLSFSGCSTGDDDSTPSDATSESASPTPSSDGTADGTDEGADDGADDGGAPAGGKTFTMRTADGEIILDGAAPTCDNPGESTLAVTFSSTDGTTVSVDAEDGKGSVRVSGATEFEGKIIAVTVGDSGDVAISGEGSLADDSAEPTSFTISGSCA